MTNGSRLPQAPIKPLAIQQQAIHVEHDRANGIPAQWRKPMRSQRQTYAGHERGIPSSQAGPSI
jgi:hypothetical protein